MTGATLAARAREIKRGLQVVCFRLNDAQLPSGETLRNQGISQSGVRYLASPHVAEAMHASGLGLQMLVGIHPPRAQGVIQMSKERALQFEEQIGLAKFDARVRRLSENEARSLITRFFDPDAVSYRTQENYFHFASAMLAARDIAQQDGVIFREITTLEVHEQKSFPSLRLVADGCAYEANAVVFAAGGGNIPFLKKLKPDHGYRIRQTPLLVVPGPPSIQAKVFYDSIHKQSIVAHKPSTRITTGCMVIGTEKGRSFIDQYCSADQREIPEAAAKEVLDHLTPQMPELASPNSHRFTAGWEVIDPEGTDHTVHILKFPEDHAHHDVIFVFPGRATLAFYAAGLAITALKQILRTTSKAQGTGAAPDATAGRSWEERDAKMHFEDYYNHMDDRKKKRG
jgi:FAD dependent oxidoreductase